MKAKCASTMCCVAYERHGGGEMEGREREERSRSRMEGIVMNEQSVNG